MRVFGVGGVTGCFPYPTRFSMGGRKVTDCIRIFFDEDKDLEWVDTDAGRIDLTPAIELKGGVEYRLELFTDATIQVWELIADGVKGLVQ